MKSRLLLIVGVVVLGVVLAAVWFLNAPPPPVPLAPVTPVTGTSAAKLYTPAPAPLPPPRVVKAAPPNSIQPKVNPAPPPLADWEVKISQVLDSKASETDTAQMLINLLPTLPAEGQADAAQHITNLITDKDYGRVLPLVRNPSLPQEVHDVLVTDLMNREDPVKLPALLDIAKLANHPYHEEAVNDLQIFLDQDNGTNWAKWDTAVKEYVKKQIQEQKDLESPETVGK